MHHEFSLFGQLYLANYGFHSLNTQQPAEESVGPEAEWEARRNWWGLETLLWITHKVDG